MGSIITLADLIAFNESNNNCNAVRFEPAHIPHTTYINKMKELVGCSTATASVLCATSWGKYQIMGDTLIDLGLRMSPIVFCASPVYQDTCFHDFIDRNHIGGYMLTDITQDAVKRATFARIYNGPGNIQGYSQRLVETAKAHGLVTA